MNLPLSPGSVYGTQLLKLHTATRLLLMAIEDERLMGRSTETPEAELREKERQTIALQTYLRVHANTEPLVQSLSVA